MNFSSDAKRIHVIQGEYKVSNDPDVVLCTVLGSCVAACMRDPVAGVGGMNHFLLPGDVNNHQMAASTRYGVYLMELLINELLKSGAKRERLEAKIIGGARVIAMSSNIGEQNARFAERFLRDEGIRIVGSNVGGDSGCKLEYWPVSGRARHTLLSGVEARKTAISEQRVSTPTPDAKVADTSVEFF